MNGKIDTVLFDLDGTLLDTHRDLAAALNAVLSRHDEQVLTDDAIRPFVSKGAMVMVCIAFRVQPTDPRALTLWQEMLEIYAENIHRNTAFFPGMEGVLEAIEKKGHRWGIVTNKPGHLTSRLLEALQIDHRPGYVVSGDTLEVKKPNPEPLLHACYKMQSRPENTVYVGDDERDIQAGKAADMSTIAAAYGYIDSAEDPYAWQADGIIHAPGELTAWLDAHNG